MFRSAGGWAEDPGTPQLAIQLSTGLDKTKGLMGHGASLVSGQATYIPLAKHVAAPLGRQP